MVSDCLEGAVRTNIVLDEKLVKEAFKHAPAFKTKRELVHLALKEYVEKRTRPNLLHLTAKTSSIRNTITKPVAKRLACAWSIPRSG